MCEFALGLKFTPLKIDILNRGVGGGGDGFFWNSPSVHISLLFCYCMEYSICYSNVKSIDQSITSLNTGVMKDFLQSLSFK